jgi:hypothetical protein
MWFRYEALNSNPSHTKNKKKKTKKEKYANPRNEINCILTLVSLGNRYIFFTFTYV